MKRHILLTSLLLLSTLALADGKLQLSSRNISTHDGLPGNTINELVQDEDGYIWMATNNGLSRYDGYSTVNYTTLDNGRGEVERIGRIVNDTTEQLLWLSTAIYTNACFDLKKKRFVNWSNEPDRQLNKFFLSASQGMFFYGMSFGVRQVKERQVTDYRKENNRLPSNEVLMILEDNSHRIWMPTDKGVCVMHPSGQTTTILNNEKIITGTTNGEDVFFLTQKGEVVAVDSLLRKQTIAQIEAPKRVNISFVWQNQIMIFTTDGAYSVDIESGKTTAIDIYNGLNQGECNGYYFIANESGHLWIFPPQRPMQSLLLLPNAHFSSNKGRKFHITANNAGQLFIATYGNGLFVWNPENGETEHFSANDEKALFKSDYLTHAICDQQDNIWLGTEGSGAYCLTKQTENNRFILPEPSHKGDWANAISAIASNTADSSIVIGTRWGGLYGYHQTTKQIEKQASLTARVTALFFDQQGRLWTGTDTEGFYVEGRHYQRGNGDGTLTINHITAFCQDHTGRIWIGTHNGGLFATSANDIDNLKFEQYLSEGVNRSRIKSLAIDTGGRLWVGTNDGIYSTDSKKSNIAGKDFRCYNRENGLFPHNEIFTMCAGSDSTLLVGASGSGVMRCYFPVNGDKPTIERITTREGLPNNNTYSIVSDKEGNIWTGTEGGIACIRPHTNLVRTFAHDNVATEKCALSTANGDIIIGTISGLFVMESANSSLLTTPANKQGSSTSAASSASRITDLRINGASLLEMGRPDEQEFQHEENSLTFLFSDFRYDESSQTLYQYYLEGLETTWQPPTTNHQAEYRDLQPGNYVFRLRSQNNDGEWNEGTVYSFTILYPWYMRWWAWGIYLLLTALIGWYLYRNWKEKFDLHQQMKLDRQLMDFRARLFTNITHEFRTPLAIIKGAIDKLDSNQAAVQTAKRSTKRMLKLVNQFMEFRKTSTGNLRLRVQQDNIISFVKEIYLDFWAMAQQKELKITFTPFTRNYNVPFDHNIVETIVYNLLSNAVKYTPEHGSIDVKVKITEAEDDSQITISRSALPLDSFRNSQLMITVEDTGPGISEEQQKVLFQPFMNGLASQGGMGIGLYMSRQMATIHKGTLEYERTDNGSRFTLTLPADDSMYAADDYLESQHPTVNSQQPTADSNEITSLIRELKPEALNDQTIVIIEDDMDMKEQIQNEVGTYFHTKTYTNGKSGYEGVKEVLPALVICDVMLPDMDGYDIVTRLKQEPETAQIPVIMLTSLADEKHQIKAYQAGADDYMVKPCNWNLLIARTFQLIKWRKEADQSPKRPNDPLGEHSETLATKGTQETTTPPNDQTTKRLITSQADKVFLTKLEMLTNQHLTDSNFNIDQLATMMNMGRTKFFGRVKEMTGMSPNKYLLKLRMEKAADLLADGELNVSEVSYKVGIQDPSYFNKLFKSYYGVIPSKYVREAQ